MRLEWLPLDIPMTTVSVPTRLLQKARGLDSVHVTMNLNTVAAPTIEPC
jgi:hypothetical protein